MNFINGQPDLNSATIQELQSMIIETKALLYDHSKSIEIQRSNLFALEQAVEHRSRQEQEEQAKKMQEKETVDNLKVKKEN